MPIERRPMPEEFELEKKREELAALESQLVERELELETLRGGLLAFEKKYQAATLERYAELDELRARLAEIQVARAPENKAAQLEAAAQRAKAEKTAAAARKFKPKPRPKDPTTKKIAPPPPPPSDFNPSETLKRLYRDVAKTIHPDLANDDTERANRHDFMARANEAYEQNSESRLAEILHEWNSSPESVRGDTPAAELIRAIRKIARCQQRLVTITIEIEKLTTGGIFGIKLLAEEAEKLESDFLADMTGRLDSEIAAAKMLLQKLDPSALPAPAATPEQRAGGEQGNA